uniref:Uncharacterized protein n=1 Tax=Pipistrellus kuhlii TaxID=59472 RepID=A0A7J7XAR4_PIPKU|nr:hypothetical protein mPipKuh1_010600 [Pipistrellus kuhlii]
MPVWPVFPPLCMLSPRGTNSSSVHSNQKEHAFIQSFVNIYCAPIVLPVCPCPSARRCLLLGPLSLTQAQMPFIFPTPWGIAVVFACLATITPSSDNSSSGFLGGPPRRSRESGWTAVSPECKGEPVTQPGL